MDPITAKLMSAAGGAAAEPVYVDDVFSIDLWTGTSSAQSITNGIDISGVEQSALIIIYPAQI